MQILIKRFAIVRDGVRYTTGSVLALPDDEAQRFIAKGMAEEVHVQQEAAQTCAAPKKASKPRARKAKKTLETTDYGEGLPSVDFGAVVK